MTCEECGSYEAELQVTNPRDKTTAHVCLACWLPLWVLGWRRVRNGRVLSYMGSED